MNSLNKKQQLFDELKRNQPRAGDILTTIDGNDILLKVRSREDGGSQRVAVFCKAAVVLEKKGWFLTENDAGITMMILPHAQSDLRVDRQNNYVLNSLRIVRYSDNGRFALCEVVE